MNVNIKKNRNRETYTFANINLMGKCNIDCFFCLGKDLEGNFPKYTSHLGVAFKLWQNFDTFIKQCKKNQIKNIYITGLNCDPTQYAYLSELIDYLQKTKGFKVGVRTNGYIVVDTWLSVDRMAMLNKCKANVGYTIHSLNKLTNRMITGMEFLPKWDIIIPRTKNCRISLVINRCNKHEFFDMIKEFSTKEIYKDVKYIQVRRVASDTRNAELMPDMVAYEEIYTKVSEAFPLRRKFWTDAEEYDIYGMPVVFWRTVKTSVNSLNFFTDGTISSNYFIIEGYLKNKSSEV